MQTPPNPERKRRMTDTIDPAVELSALRERVSHMSATLDRVADRVGDVVAIRELASQDRNTMARIENSISALTSSVQVQVDALRKEQDERWATHAATHGAVDKKINFAVGWVSGVGVLGALLVGMVVWVTDYRFSQVNAEAAAIPTLRDKVHAVELHLARDRGQQYPTNGEKP